MAHPPAILTIAGSDSGGGAGIQADLKTILALGAYGQSVITALTAQNGLGVTGIHAPEASFVALQLKTVRDGFPVAAAKTGMLFSSGIIEAVEAGLRDRLFPLVVDPVCVSQSGHRLLREDAVNALKWHMLPNADLLTPNLPEAELLSGVSITSFEELEHAARELLATGAKAVLIKGGHFGKEGLAGMENVDSAGGRITDWLALPDAPLEPFAQTRIDTPHNHGTGCTLSAAIATHLGFGCELRDAVRGAQAYLHHCLRHGFAPGLGAGPPNHGAWITGRVAPVRCAED